jgi:acyl carrier protein
MSEVRERLVSCVQAVFPDLSGEQAQRASTSRVAAWDSLATVTLAAAVEEEFEIEFAPEEIETLTSYDMLLTHVTARISEREAVPRTAR